MKKIFIAFIIVFITIIIIFASNTYIDRPADQKKDAIRPVNKDSLKRDDSTKRIYLLGKFDPSKDSNYIQVKGPYSNNSSMYLRKEVFEAYKVMYDSAKKAGINLLIISATRNFDVQKSIWEGKYNGSSIADKIKRSENILKYSSMPGTSRHHWGTDIDLNSVQLSTFETPSGKKLYNWLHENTYKYGFCQPYTLKDSMRTSGYEEEKWHWSYYPVSNVYLKEYNRLITYDDISGFKGSETAKELDVIKNYVNAVNQNCK